MREQDDKFPRNVISYSALKYLQKKHPLKPQWKKGKLLKQK